MKEKKTKEFDRWETWPQQTYRTGGTQPPKNHGGLIAFLLALVIFLCGISTALGLMNIHLFRQLSAMHQEETAPVRFSQAAQAENSAKALPLGFSGQTVPDFWCNYRGLPRGVYVTEVVSGSDACGKGVRPGDILVAMDQVDVPDTQTLQALLLQRDPGQQVELTLVRDDQQLQLNVILQE